MNLAIFELTVANHKTEKGLPDYGKNEHELLVKTEALYKIMKAERETRKLSGYYFIFNDEEKARHQRSGKSMLVTCSEMVRAAKETGKTIKLFKNMNGEIAARLVRL